MKKCVYVLGVLWLIFISVPLLFKPTIDLGITFFLSCVCVLFWASELEKIEKYASYSEQYDKLHADILNRKDSDEYWILGLSKRNRILDEAKSRRNAAFEEYQENYVIFRFSPLVIMLWLVLPLIGNEAPLVVVWGFWESIIF